MKTITLQVDTYDKNDNCTVIFFEVPKDWLVSYLNDQDLKEFLDEYTSDESSEIYSIALLQNKIISKSIG